MAAVDSEQRVKDSFDFQLQIILVKRRTFMDPKEKKILEEKLKDFMKDIIPVELFPYLPCLTRFDRDEIQASQNNHGSVRASFVLVDRLKRRRDGFQQFVQALRECGSQHIALMLDPDCRYTCQGKDMILC